MSVSHDALFQNCINGSTPPNSRADKAQDTTYPHEPLAQIQNNFTQLYLINCTNGSALLNKRAVRALD